ncbi:hypothetical protein AMTR_s00017p00017660 [Amborella trichopoda]|uniref:Uncharacterized protein n=1 Tax=Amborella trichopoda TaxID=13333 RepID=W1PLG9_AMBTC|nr:hypothetical protein AMTR_s00017p00017660 [Amborella trichopoda]
MEAAKPCARENVCHVSDTVFNLMLVMHIIAAGHSVVYIKEFENLMIEGDPIRHGHRMEKHYILFEGTPCGVDDSVNETGIREIRDTANDLWVTLTQEELRPSQLEDFKASKISKMQLRRSSLIRKPSLNHADMHRRC